VDHSQGNQGASSRRSHVSHHSCLLDAKANISSHSDFERGFIMAEVMKYEDLKELGSEAAVKANGKYVQKGKDYTVADGDIIFFKFNVTAPAKKK